jgi:protein-disulfide isomerase
MTGKADRIASWVLTASALVIALSVGAREWRAMRAVGRPSTAPELIDDWKAIVPLGAESGNAAAPIKVIVFSDFECPGCKTFHTTLSDLVARRPRDVSIVSVNLPLAKHRCARPAAEAFECAARVKRHPSMEAVLYSKHDSLGVKSWVSFAIESGIVDTKAFRSCLTDSATAHRIDAQMALAERLEVHGTPTVLVNGWRYPLPPSKARLEQAIDAILRGDAP